MRDLSRLLRPQSIALFGGSWAANVAEQLDRSGFTGNVWPVHPTRTEVGGFRCFRTISDLPSTPDASFVGVNRDATLQVINGLRQIGAGGATCFASGFREAETDSRNDTDLQARLVEAAGDMPILGPNCYGFVNYLDNVALWPDQHGGRPTESGVAIVAQSSNIAINLTMQHRGLPIGYVVASGNQAQTSNSELATAMLEDERVTAIGLYLEGFGDIHALENLATKARQLSKPVVALKIGRSEKAQTATLTHTASLAGGSDASSALLKRLGIIEVTTLDAFIETLKLLHSFGNATLKNVCSVSCSGGEATLMADTGHGTNLIWRDFSDGAQTTLEQTLGPRVTVCNPLDYHTYIWGDVEKMTEVFSTVIADNFDLSIFVLDVPRSDRCDPESFQCAIEAILSAKAAHPEARVAVLASLPENMSEELADTFFENGIVPLHGMDHGLRAVDTLSKDRRAFSKPVKVVQNEHSTPLTLTESDAKEALAKAGINVPRAETAYTPDDIPAACQSLTFPIVVKGLGIAHKSDAGAIALNINSVGEAHLAAKKMSHAATGFLVEEMVTHPIAEILVGVTRDTTGLMLVTVGTGGILTELLEDTAHFLLPETREGIRNALEKLRINKILDGYRGQPRADKDALIDTIQKICDLAVLRAEHLIALEVNPLIAKTDGAVAVDALIQMGRPE